MNAGVPKTSDSETLPPTTRTRRMRTPAPIGAKWGLVLFAGFAVLLGGATSAVALSRVIETLRGNPPKNADWSLELGLVLISLGVVSVVAGVGMWRRRRWGWWLMASLLLVVSLVITNGAVIQLGILFFLLWGLRPQFGFPGSFQTLEPDIDEIAKSLGIDWAATPLARISQLLAAKQDVEATRQYREHFDCDRDEAQAAIAHWQTETVVNKLRHIAHVVESQRPKPG